MTIREMINKAVTEYNIKLRQWELDRYNSTKMIGYFKAKAYIEGMVDMYNETHTTSRIIINYHTPFDFDVPIDGFSIVHLK